MRIGIIVDGQAEYRSLTRMFPRIGGEATVVRPLHADLQPKASTAKLIRAALPSVRILARKNVQRILMVLDHEGRPGCVLMWRSQLEAALNQPCKRAGVTDVKVVFKVQMFENWLISDPGAIRAMPNRFSLSDGDENQIRPDRADRADAMRILKRSAQGREYNKTRDAVAIMAKFDPYAGARNSRSFRRFLRLVGAPTYQDQSKAPA